MTVHRAYAGLTAEQVEYVRGYAWADGWSILVSPSAVGVFDAEDLFDVDILYPTDRGNDVT